LLKAANKELAVEPSAILEAIAREKAVFTQGDIRHFISKHTPLPLNERVFSLVMAQKNLLKLYDKNTREETGNFTLKEVREEEEKLLRFAKKINKNPREEISLEVKQEVLGSFALSKEQLTAFEMTTSSANLSIIEGRAGVGKSYILKPIREAHELSGYRVVGLSPTSKVARDLSQEGFRESYTVHSFLFKIKNGREIIDKNTVVVLDEAAMLSTEICVELFNEVKMANSKLILIGDDRQLNSIERGGFFKFLRENYQTAELKEVRRQQVSWQREVSEYLSLNKGYEAAQLLEKHQALKWSYMKETALTSLINEWRLESLVFPKDRTFILAQRNVDVDAINFSIREIRKERGELGEKDFMIETLRGEVPFSIGERVQFCLTDKKQGILNGYFGTLKMVSETTCMVSLDNGETITLDPTTYKGLRHGYAGTVYKAQGSTLDKTYILHDIATNSNNSYVALTRQSKELNIFLNRRETPTLSHFIRQISREGGKTSSLNYYTESDIKRLEKEEKGKLVQVFLQDKAKEIWLGIKDYFHNNDKFYNFKEQENSSIAPIKEMESIYFTQAKTFQEIKESFERRLYVKFEEYFGRLASDEDKVTHAKQAQRAAEYYMIRAGNKNKIFTQTEVNHLLERAKFEIKRQDEIKESVLDKLSNNKELIPEDHLRAALYGERLARIEGRLFELDLRNEVQEKDYYTYMKNAEIELQNSQELQKEMKQHFRKESNLADHLANIVAQEIVRHLEKEGSLPSQKDINNFIKLSEYFYLRRMELKELFKEEAPYKQERTINFVLRREAEMLFNGNAKLEEQHLKTAQAEALSEMHKELRKVQQLEKEKVIDL